MTKLEADIFGAICLAMSWTFILLKFPWWALPFLVLSLISFGYAARKEWDDRG